MKIVKLQSSEDKFRATVERLHDEVRWLGETQLKKAYDNAVLGVADGHLRRGLSEHIQRSSSPSSSVVLVSE